MGGRNPLNQLEFVSRDMDYIGRFENLHDDFKSVAKKIGMKNATLPYKRPSRHSDYKKYYTPEIKKIIDQKFAKEIKFFGFTYQ